jgi:hypothetical protein
VTIEAGFGVRPKVSNLSTLRPELLPISTTFSAISTVGMLITHCRVACSASKLKLLLLTMHPTSGGSNSIIVSHDMVMTLALPLWAVVSSTTGPGSSRP